MIGKKLLHYEIIDKLGEGGMGEVYRGRDSKLGRDVAVKVLPEDMYKNPERRRRFEREARVIAALNHPNIVTIYSVEEAQRAIDRGAKGYNRAFVFLMRGTAGIGRGHIEAGLADIDEACAVFESLGTSGQWAANLVGHYRWIQSYALDATGNFERSIAAAKRGIDRDPRFTAVYLALLRGQLAMGRVSDAENTFRDLRNVQAGNHTPSDAFNAALAEALMEAARGNADAALGALKRADAMPVEDRTPSIQWVIEGDVKSGAGDIEGAIVSYRKAIYSTEFLLDPELQIAVIRIPVYYELARLEEASGQLAEARDHYRTYLDCWGKADIKIPDVEDARARLQALERM